MSEGMNTEKIINGLEKIIKGVYRQEYSDYLEAAIELLRAYKAMWGENMKVVFRNSKEGNTIHPTRVLLDLERLEQEYFPKGVNHD